MVLSENFERALIYATHLHGGQPWVVADLPMLAHLLGTASLVLEYGGSEEQAIAGLLHEAAEETGGLWRRDDIRARFGAAVGDLVRACGECFDAAKPPWRARKAAYIGKIPHFTSAARLISLADQLHHARALLRELVANGEKGWKCSEGGKDGLLWYHRCLLRAYRGTGAEALLDELEAALKYIDQFAAAEKQAQLPLAA